MAQSHFSLSWNGYKKNFCGGLSVLQQNGELVDMTLAADGHFVKVHQVVIALASPYIKELITSVQCQHPVIFLNKISYSTLCYLLEYIYTGEVLVSIEKLNEFMEAGRELHIKGLEDMNLPHSISLSQQHTESFHQERDNLEENKITSDYLEKAHIYADNDSTSLNEKMEDVYENVMYDDVDEDSNDIFVKEETAPSRDKFDSTIASDASSAGLIQYTVSNQGSLQMILNRFLYYLKYTNRNNSRQWRCVNYLSMGLKCPAIVFTKNDIVLQRISAHNHPFHDKKILKKVKDGAIFSAIQEAEKEGNSKKLIKGGGDESIQNDTE